MPSDEFTSRKHQRVREIFRDDTLWVLDKPAGILSHPNPPARQAPNALIRDVYDYDRELYRLTAPGKRQRQVHLVHRLDQETSGIILCTFHPDAAARLREDLFHGDLHKEYRALVLGAPRERRGEWRDCLQKTSTRSGVAVTVGAGRPNATTRFEVLDRFPESGLALLGLEPETGRTHQLRVQASSRHFPVAGDERYGDFTANRFLELELGLKHMFLHALRVTLRHPRSGHLMRFEAPLTRRLATPLERARELRRKVPRRR